MSVISVIYTYLVKMKFLQMYIYEDTSTHNYLPWYDSAHQESCKKSIPYNLAKRIIVFV